MKTSYQLGQEAYHKGISCSAHDPAMMNIMEGAKVGEKTDELRDWVNGFENAKEAEIKKLFPELYS